jgi:hypothetical protein
MTETMRLTAETAPGPLTRRRRPAYFAPGRRSRTLGARARTCSLGSFVMAPWVGRLRDARPDYGDAQYRSPPTVGRMPQGWPIAAGHWGWRTER